MPTAPTAQSSTQRAHLDASDKRGRAQRRLSWTGYFVALLATYQAASCGSDPPPSSIDDTASTSVTGTPIGIHPAMPHPWQYGIGGLGGGGGEPGGGGAGAAECVSAADCPAPPACFDAVCVDGECHETPAAIGSPCDDGDECAAEACTCVRSDACVPLTAQVQAFLTHHWRADAGSQAAPPLWTDMLGDRPFHGEVGTAPALGNDDETQRACWQFDGVDDRLVLDAGQLTSATTSRTWLWVRRVAGVTGATTYFLRSTNDHAETVGSIAGAGREYNVGLRTPAPGACFLPFDLRPSHTRVLAAEALLKTAST